MLTPSFLIWFVFIAIVASIGIGAMVQAYVGSGSLAVLFPEPITLPADAPAPTLNPEAATQFQQGCEAYRSGNYRKAVNRFTQATRLDPQFAEAYHNRGRAIANLRQDNEAAQILVEAGERYLQQGDSASFAQIKQDLEALKARKQAREAAADS